MLFPPSLPLLTTLHSLERLKNERRRRRRRRRVSLFHLVAATAGDRPRRGWGYRFAVPRTKNVRFALGNNSAAHVIEWTRPREKSIGLRSNVVEFRSGGEGAKTGNGTRLSADEGGGGGGDALFSKSSTNTGGEIGEGRQT